MIGRLVGSDRLLPLILGLADGVLNALTLASARFFNGGGGPTLGLAIRIAIAAVITAGSVFFVAQYAENRVELLRAARHLTLASETHLVSETALGGDILRDALAATLVAAAASFPGAFLPLAIASAGVGPAWTAVVFSVVLLALLGFGVGRLIQSRPFAWSAALALAGVILAAVGVMLDIA